MPHFCWRVSAFRNFRRKTGDVFFRERLEFVFAARRLFRRIDGDFKRAHRHRDQRLALQQPDQVFIKRRVNLQSVALMFFDVAIDKSRHDAFSHQRVGEFARSIPLECRPDCVCPAASADIVAGSVQKPMFRVRVKQKGPAIRRAFSWFKLFPLRRDQWIARGPSDGNRFGFGSVGGTIGGAIGSFCSACSSTSSSVRT